MRRRWELCSVLLCLAAGLGFAQDRIAGAPDLARTVRLAGHVHPLAQARYDQGPVDAATEISMVTLLLKPSPSQQAALGDLLARQQNASSPDFRRWLTPEEFAGRFGATAGDVAKVAAWLQSEGLQVNEIARGRTWIPFSGAAERVGRAFRTEIHRYNVDGESHFANSTDPAIPAAFEPVIGGFYGLNDLAKGNPQVSFNNAVRPEFNSSNGRHYLAPDDINTIYNVKPLHDLGIDGTGQTIAIVGEADINVSDIRAFRAQFGLPPNDPVPVLVGRDPGTSSNTLVEADLDIEWTGAIAPNASITYVYASNAYTAAQYAVDQNLAPVISMSFGNCEHQITPSYRSVIQQAAAQGITWIAASGDSGAAGCDYGSYVSQATRGLSADFPASAPEITAIGGSTFSEGTDSYWSSSNTLSGASAVRYIPETAWNDSANENRLASTGGGASIFFSKPPWQRGAGVPDDGARDVPDISLSASAAHDGYLVLSGGSLLAVGGTSVGAPEFSGLVALLNQYLGHGSSTNGRLGNINSTLYQLAQNTSDVFHDITSGDNIMPCAQGSPDCPANSLGYSAAPGYDLATGLGSVDAYHMITEWTAVASAISASTTTISATPSTVDFYSGLVQLTATVSASGGTPTGTVAFVANDSTLGTADLTGGEATVTVSASQLGVGALTVSAMYSGDRMFASSFGSATVAVNPPAGAAVAGSASPNPVYQRNPNSLGDTWLVTITLKEYAGVAASITNFTYNNSALSIPAFFPSPNIPAFGTVSTSIGFKNLSPPVSGVVRAGGTDANGQTWSVTIPLQFVSTKILSPRMILSSTPSSVAQNASAEASCQWSQQLTVEEASGYTVALTKLIAGSLDLTSQLQQIFGTTRLGPFGRLAGTVCFSGIRAPIVQSYELDGTTDQGGTVVATASASLLIAAPGAPTLTVSPPSVAIQVARGGSGDASLSLGLGGAPVAWSVSILPARASNWLAVSQASGTGDSQLSIHASGAGLASGVYSATLIVQSLNSLPQYINVPITFVAGASSSTLITGLAHGASFKTSFAPGMVMSVFGSRLAPDGTALSASLLPLPLNLAGVSATINGISAPVYYVSPGQLNLQIPYEAGAGPAVLGVNNNGEVASVAFQVAVTAPGIFTDAVGNTLPFSRGKAGDTLVMFITGDGDLAPTLPTGNTPASGTPVARLPEPRQQVTLTVGGVPAVIQFVGVPPGLAGVTQINFTVPPGIAPGPQQVVVAVGGVPSPPATLTVTQ